MTDDPPSLHDLVLAHETFDKITLEAWDRFDADMAEWKAKVRYGELHVPSRPQTRFKRRPIPMR